MIARALGALTETVIVDDLAAAVRDAAAQARAGRRGLAVAGVFELRQFRNYAERGKVFKRLVQAIMREGLAVDKWMLLAVAALLGDGGDDGVEHQLSLFPRTLRRRHLFFPQAADRHGRGISRAGGLFDLAIALISALCLSALGGRLCRVWFWC